MVVPPSESLDRRSPTLSTDRSRSPTIALQDYLNEREEALWGLVTNGTHLRLLRDNASLTRPAHIEADLAQIFANEDAASFAALWLLIHRSRFGAVGTPATDCALERYRETGAREGEAARDRLAGQVEVALRVLGSGFLEANPDLARRLRSGELALTPWFNELLRLVYRLIFLMVAEDRGLLHPANARTGARRLYAEGYSLAALRAQCVRGATWDRYHDRYEGMKIVFRALAAGEAALGLPALGGLFAPEPDPKLEALVGALMPLLKQGANPVVFCRFLATAEHVRNGLRKAFPKLRIEAVTGVLTPDERRDRVADMAPVEDEKEVQRILVATDCLSEGINLQQLFDTVVHYDLSWNPTKHQQREGRVDRFGQPAELVRSIMMYSPDSAIDGAVLDVILRKAEEIRKATGVTVPLPNERGPVTDALMASMMLRRGDRKQLALDLRLDSGTRLMDARWRDVSEKEKRSRTRFAQNAMKPREVAPEWEKAVSFLGSPNAARGFVERTMTGFGIPLEPRGPVMVAHVHALEHGLRERLEQQGLSKSVRLAPSEPAPSGTALLTRTHPLTATLAEALVEASLDPGTLTGLGIGRVGAWPTAAVDRLTRVALLRIRYKATVHARRERLLLAEEAALVALQDGAIVASGDRWPARRLPTCPPGPRFLSRAI